TILLSIAPTTLRFCFIPHYSFVSFFLLSCYAPHRLLHSFPTRRSSDLALRSGPCHCGQSNCPPKAFCAEVATMRASAIFRYMGRSEEHTSELQSRFDLVCRLLLEKKK